MGIISWIILGLIAGWIASKIVNKTGSGMFMDIGLGVVGAIVGGILRTPSGIGGDRGEHRQHHHLGHRRRLVVVGLPQVRPGDLNRPQPAAPQRAAAVSSPPLASIHPSTAPSTRTARFQKGARVFK